MTNISQDKDLDYGKRKIHQPDLSLENGKMTKLMDLGIPNSKLEISNFLWGSTKTACLPKDICETNRELSITVHFKMEYQTDPGCLFFQRRIILTEVASKMVNFTVRESF